MLLKETNREEQRACYDYLFRTGNRFSSIGDIYGTLMILNILLAPLDRPQYYCWSAAW